MDLDLDSTIFIDKIYVGICSQDKIEKLLVHRIISVWLANFVVTQL